MLDLPIRSTDANADLIRHRPVVVGQILDKAIGHGSNNLQRFPGTVSLDRHAE
jgi:hypothetical protein